MAVTIDGSSGIASVDGSAGSPSSRGSDSNSGIFYSSNAIKFSTDGTERMEMTTNGFNLGGNNTPGDANTNTGVAINTNGKYFFSMNSDAGHLNRNSDGTCLHFRRSGNLVGTVTVNSSNTSYNTSSDYRLKENVTALTDGITRLKTLKPYRFNFKVTPSETVDGFLAHEVTAVPEAITGTKDEVNENNDPVFQQIDQSKLVPLLTAALKEAVAKIEILETKVAALEAG